MIVRPLASPAGRQGYPSRAGRGILSAMLAATLAGCSGSNALSTGSLFGGGNKAKTAAAAAAAPAAPPPPRNDPVARAFSTGAVSARAQKCGFNFDPARLKSSYLAFEAQSGTPVEELAKSEKLYNVTQNSVAKAIATEPDYCTPARVAFIRGDLTRHLAGDFAPGQPKSFAKEDPGVFSFGGDSSEQ
ncbi:MAG: hypothetical protein CTY20_15605 [Hyphomicrobium sp.]|nr:MAG: hypothetical protein CTY20_15605 [Hyphomicrobium sp.]